MIELCRLRSRPGLAMLARGFSFIRANLQTPMPERQPDVPNWLKHDFDAIHGEVISLTENWILWRDLFDKGRTRINLLRSTADVFFWTVGDALSRNMLLTLWKLSRPKKDAGYDSQSLEYLQQVIASNDLDRSYLRQLGSLRKSFQRSAKAIDNIRNKYLAHFDREAFRKGKLPFSSPDREATFEMIVMVHEFMSSVWQRYTGSTMNYMDMHMLGGSEQLVDFLKRAARWGEHLRDGLFGWDDLEKGKFRNA